MTNNDLKVGISKDISGRKKSHYRVKAGKCNVYVGTKDEARRVKAFAIRLLKSQEALND